MLNEDFVKNKITEILITEYNLSLVEAENLARSNQKLLNNVIKSGEQSLHAAALILVWDYEKR